MGEYKNLRVDREEGIATVTLDSTSGQNTLQMDIVDELVSIAASLGEDPDTRCIVLTHTGKFFSAGADLSQFSGDESDGKTIRQVASRLHDAIIQFHQSRTPVVGGINGIATGAGFSLAIMPDLVLLGEDAYLKFAYPGIGLTGDGGSTFFLPRLVGLRTAKELVLRDIPVEADEAVEIGLANEVVSNEEFDGRLHEIALEIAKKPTHALGTTSYLLTQSYDNSLEKQLAAETDALAKATQTEDYQRGIDAFFESSDPDFVGR